MEAAADRVKLNVGGRIFETTMTTLASAGYPSFFSALLADRWKNAQPNTGTGTELFIGRHPACFDVVLQLLRTGDLLIPEGIPKDLLYKEAQFYGLEGHLRAAVREDLDRNFPRLSHSETSRGAFS
ncbi:hypothetical protein CRG98_049659, partial [Punica granatum]